MWIKKITSKMAVNNVILILTVISIKLFYQKRNSFNVNRSRCEESRELVDLGCDAGLNSVEHPTDFTLSKSIPPTHNYESNPHFDFSAEELLYAR